VGARSALAFLAALSLACAGSGDRFLSIATGGTGGVYYPYGGGLAKLISEKIPAVQATAEVTGASVDNLKLLQQGRADLAFTLADTLAKLDACFWSGGLPTPSVQDLAMTSGIRLVLLPNAEFAAPLTAKYGAGLYGEAMMPARSYRGVLDPVPVITVGNLLVASAGMPEELAHDITKLLFDEQRSLIAIHPEARHLAPATGPADSPAPFHPGAVRYYRARSWK
jgi:uncharacterized protein